MENDGKVTKPAPHRRPALGGLGAVVLSALVCGLIYLAYRSMGEEGGSPVVRMSSSGSRGFTPAFRLQDARGNLRSSEELAGKGVVLHFWATWCAPCIEEIPKFLKAAKESAHLPLTWVAVSLDPTWAEAERTLPSKQWLSEVPALWVLLDPEQKVSEAFGSFQFPETYLFDSEGKRLAKWVGPQPWDHAELRRALELRFASKGNVGVSPFSAPSEPLPATPRASPRK
jgi:cytochrome c biogenesis protein CcmG/thiol:disulfide interchange protein DsbE